jgi:hypothetical protein
MDSGSNEDMASFVIVNNEFFYTSISLKNGQT